MQKHTEPITQHIDHLFRQESGKMTAVLTRIFGFKNSNLIEDIVQETFLSAMKTWPLKGSPDNPSAWLMQVAKNKTLNALRERKKMSVWNPNNQQEADHIGRLFLDHEIQDSQMRMLFACCYPQLAQRVQIMVTLKTLSGFSNEEIASALLMSSTAVKKAIYRAKKEMQVYYHDGIPVPDVNLAKKRLETVYTILYLMFNEGYKRSYNDHVISEDLCFEAVRLTILILDIKGVNHGKTHALLSLMYFSMARFPARRDGSGRMVDLKFQDRLLWDKNSINAGFYHLKISRESTALSKYHLESGIASLHCSAASYEKTNWKGILDYYEKLKKLENSEVIRLNYAIVLSKVKGAAAGLKALDQVEPDTTKEKQFLFLAARADMNAELKNYEIAKSYYQVAFDMAHSKADKNFLRSKIEECNRHNLSDN